MAQKYRKIDPRIWGDEKFAGLTDPQKLVALFCLSCDQTNRIGIFKFSRALAAEELGTPVADFEANLAAVCDRLSWKYDAQARVLYLPTWWRYNDPIAVNNLLGALKDLHDLPHSPLLDEFIANVKHLPEAMREDFNRGVSDTLGEGYPHPSPDPYPTQKQKQKQEQESALAPLVLSSEDPKPKPKAGPRPKSKTASVDLPENLRTESFVAKWAEWCAYRKEIRRPMAGRTQETQLKQLSAAGEPAALQKIDIAIQNGWTGCIFREDERDRHSRNGRSQAPTKSVDKPMQYAI